MSTHRQELGLDLMLGLVAVLILTGLLTKLGLLGLVAALVALMLTLYRLGSRVAKRRAS